jgi:serine/threonine protein kinase
VREARRDAEGVRVHAINGFTDLIEIGRGGYGVVYRAQEEAFERSVAIKVLTAAALTEEGERRFRSELRALGALTGHPNIVTVHSAGTTGEGHPYLVMSYLPGGSLGDLVEASGPRPWEEVLDHGVRLAGALASAHARGILHRDIKPENVLLSPLGEPCLADFGIAKIQGGTETRTGQVAASLAHAPPEILDGRRPVPASDVYSLASTMFALLHGAPAFLDTEDHSTAPMLVRIFTAPVPDLRGDGVPDRLCAVLEAAMAKEPEARPQTAQAFGDALQGVQVALGLLPTPMRVGDAIVLPTLPSAGAPPAFLPPPLPSEPLAADPAPTRPPPPAAPAAGPLEAGPLDTGPPEAGPPAADPGPPPPSEPPPGLPLRPFTPAPLPEPAGPDVTARHAPPQPGSPGSPADEPPSRSRVPVLAGAAVLALLVVVGAVALLRGGDGGEQVAAGLADATAGEEALSISFDEDAGLCDGELHDLGVLSGAEPGERIVYDGAGIDGGVAEDARYEGVADDLGQLTLEWRCAPGYGGVQWDVTARGEESGRSVAFTVKGVEGEHAAAPTSEPAPEPTSDPTTAPTLDPRLVYPTDRDFAQITGIALDGDRYAVDFRTFRYDAVIPGRHVHFFFDTVPPEEAGIPGQGPWFLWATPTPFREWGPADRPEGAEELCILVAEEDHSVQADSGNCWPLP